MSTIVDTMPKSGSGVAEESPEEIVNAICADLLSKVPEPFVPEITKEMLKKLPGGPTQPLTVHLGQEIDRLNIIIILATRLSEPSARHRGHDRVGGRLGGCPRQAVQRRHPRGVAQKSWESATIGTWFRACSWLSSWISG